MEGARYARNDRTGNIALAQYSKKNIEGIGKEEYSCLECCEKLILRKGITDKEHYTDNFAHKPQDKACSYYSKSVADLDECTKKKHNERIHQIAIQELKKLLENNYQIVPIRHCSAKGGCKNFTSEVVRLKHNHRSHTVYKTEEPIMHDGKERKLDLVRIDDGKIKYIFEILDCNRTSEDSRPIETDWFELYAEDIIAIRTKIDNMGYDITEGIDINCQRLIFKCRDCFEAEQLCLAKMQEELKKKELEKQERARLRLEKELEKQERARLRLERERKKEEKERNELNRILEDYRKKEIYEEQQRIAYLKQQEKLRLEEIENKERRRLANIEYEKTKKIMDMKEQERLRLKDIENKELRRLEKIQKIEEENNREEERKIRQLQIKKEEAIKQKELENLNKKCKGCNINNCKCKVPNFTTNEHNVIWCTCCKKRKCMCTRIDKFFNKV